MMKKTLSIVIPAYNEQESIGRLLDNLCPLALEKQWKIVVVNDGSRDNTLETIRQHQYYNQIELVQNKVNKGYGGAIKEGIRNCGTDLVITIDADGQHELNDIQRMYDHLVENDADMVVGSRMRQKNASLYRALGKTIIRRFTRLIMKIGVQDINSGIKMYRRDLASVYMSLCPDSMPYSDVIALVFINQRHLVSEIDVSIHKRIDGTSTISTKTAFQTLYAILNIAMFFNPLRVFLPLSCISLVAGLAWGLPIIVRGNGVSVGALFALITALLLFILGLIAEQLRQIRKTLLENELRVQNERNKKSSF
jgi:glycosyltransferase involved in cell wall biosynthesis